MTFFQSIYRRFIEILTLKDDEDKGRNYEEFFYSLKSSKLTSFFNWAEEIVEGLNLKERGEQSALLWVSLDSWDVKRYTYSDFVSEANKLINFLRGHGMRKGSKLYIMLPQVPEVFFATYASIKAGFVGVPTAVVMTVRELQYRFKAFPPDAIIADVNSARLVDEALKASNSRPNVKILVGGDIATWESYESIKKESALAEAAKTNIDDIVLAFFTSGTTGLPKIVAHTAVSYPVGHLSTAAMINAKPGDLHNNLSAPGWAKFAWSSFFPPLSIGATTSAFYHAGKLPAEKYLQAINDFNVNTFCAPPTAWRLFRAQVKLNEFKFEDLKEVVSAGEPLNPELYYWFKEATGIEIRDMYGQTETTAMIGNPPWWKGGKIRPGSFGRPIAMYDIVLLNDDGREINNAGEVGHIAIRLKRWRAIGLMKEYIGDPNRMKETFVNGYYYTGDKAYFDTNGYWWSVGRADDVIKSSDYRIGPYEVESALVEHHAVAEAAAVASPDPMRYQVVKAFVSLKPGFIPSKELAKDIWDHLLNVLPRYELPKTISGKIRRVELRELEMRKRNKGERGEKEYFFEEVMKAK